MRKITASLLFLFGHTLGAQNAQTEINDQVWKPFIKTFTENNTEGFMAIHSKDLVRSSRDDHSVIDWNTYFENTKKGEERSIASKRKRTIDLRFLERIANQKQAVEVGIYKTSSTLPDGTTRDSFGKFTVVLRKENGIWKILVDTDSSEGGTINAQSFLSARPME